MQVKLVKSFARIHKANLINFGIVPLTFVNADDYNLIGQDEEVVIPDFHRSIAAGVDSITLEIGDRKIAARLEISDRHREILVAGSLLNWARGS